MPWTPRSTWHLTLTFFGDAPDGALPDLEATVAATVREVEPFTIYLAGGGAYRSTVMWVGVGGETSPLAEAMHELAGVRDELTAMGEGAQGRPVHTVLASLPLGFGMP